MIFLEKKSVQTAVYVSRDVRNMCFVLYTLQYLSNCETAPPLTQY